jgi:23S rRNA pseudouridine1911/1915/1917 synthase
VIGDDAIDVADDEDELEGVEPIELRVEEADAGMRLDRFLASHIRDRSRALIQKHIEMDAVQIDGASPKRGASTALHAGDAVRYLPPPPEPIDVEPEDIPLSVLFEDEHLLIVDKQAGLVVHPAAGHSHGTLVNAVLYHLARPAARAKPGAPPPRPGIVHRLDRDTTGVMVVAKTEAMQDALGRSFHERRVDKRYLAVVLGVPSARKGTFDTGYGRHPRDRKKFSSKVRDGKRAITHYEVKETLLSAALMAIRLETGRTHQIRVHFADAGHPLIGDAVYGPKKLPKLLESNAAAKAFGRQALHAERIAFDHPVTGARIDVTAPAPADLAALIEDLRALGRRE